MFIALACIGNYRKLQPSPPYIFFAHSYGEKMSALGGPDNGPSDRSVFAYGLKMTLFPGPKTTL